MNTQPEHTVDDIVRAAIPDADGPLCSHILWGRTPFPCGKVTAQSIYRAASGYARASAHGMKLCTFCHRPADEGKWECAQCDAALRQAAT